MFNLRKANLNESEKILKFYKDTIDSLKGSEFKPKWSNKYPNLEYLERCIKKEELYICTENDNIIASVVINNSFNPDYENINWNYTAKSQDEIIIIHAFAVSPDYSGKGIGREIFNQIEYNAIKKK